MADNIKVMKPVVNKLQNGGTCYEYQKFNDKNDNGKLDKGEQVLGSITIYDHENDGFDSHDGVVNNNFGSMAESLWNPMMKQNKTVTEYRDVSNVPANPVTGKTYVDVKGTKNDKGLFTITSEKAE